MPVLGAESGLLFEKTAVHGIVARPNYPTTSPQSRATREMVWSSAGMAGARDSVGEHGPIHAPSTSLSLRPYRRTLAWRCHVNMSTDTGRDDYERMHNCPQNMIRLMS